MQSLASCPQGTRGKIVELATADRRILGKLASLGIIPGASFKLLRHRPVLVLQSGYTKVALDPVLGGYIFIETAR